MGLFRQQVCKKKKEEKKAAARSLVRLQRFMLRRVYFLIKAQVFMQARFKVK